MGSYDIKIFTQKKTKQKTPPKHRSNRLSNAMKVYPYLDGPFVHFLVLADVKDLMLLCRGWNRRREKFGFFHIVCKTV